MRMILTNATNLPQAIVDAVRNDTYTKGKADISITGLLKPMRAVALESQHSEGISEDVADRLYALYGQIVHGILERAASSYAVAERRLYLGIDGVWVSGQMDSYEIKDDVLVDWKFVTAWKFKQPDPPKEWIQQLNCYAELLRANGYPIKKLQVVGLIRDHSKLEAKRDSAYPQFPIVRIEIPMWEQKVAQDFIRERVKAYKDAKVTLPECTPEERWAKPDIYAVMKKGRKSAVRLFHSEEEAKNFIDPMDQNLSIVKRPAENMRCENYCAAAPYCDQFKALLPQE